MELKDLIALTATLRDMGVVEYKCGDVFLKLGPLPVEEDPQHEDDAVGEDPASILMDSVPPRYKRAFGIR